MAFGHEEDLWELAMLYFEDGKHHITYDTDITDNVIDYLSDEEVYEILEKIKNLK